jgi:outer membrane protein OmpA-like peptidoglycan-associated protein
MNENKLCLKRLLLTGVAISVIVLGHSAMARDDSASFVVAQQDQDKKQNKGEQRRDQKQQQRQDRRGQEQQQKQQRQDLKQQQRDQNIKGQDRREQRQDLRQEQRKDDKQQRQQQQQQRQDLKEQQKQQQQKQQEQRLEQQKKQQEQRNERGQRQDLKSDQKQQQEQLRDKLRDQKVPGPERRDQLQDLRKDQRDDRKELRQDQRGGQSGRDNNARKLDDVRGERRESKEGNRTIIQEGNRTIVRDGNRTFIRRDESDRFRRVGRDVNVQRVGGETRTVVVSPNGQRVVTVTDANGRLLRRSRFVNNREVIIIDNRPRGGRRADAFFVVLPALAIASLAIPRDRYIVEAEGAPPEYIYGALMAPPVEALPRAYTLDEIRYSPEVRDRMPRIDLDTITFDLGSWEIAPDQYNRLAPIAEGIRRAIAQNPDEVFLIEGHTDATGNDDDNLSLSDRRAEAASIILTDEFQIPPENLTTQGYGSQQMKIPSQGAERANRRVTVRRITPLLQQGQAAGAPPR